MQHRALISSVILIASALAVAPASAQSPVKVGRLRCHVDAGLGMVIASSKDMQCEFTSLRGGRRDHYVGTIEKFGLDVGRTDRGIMIWDVITATPIAPRGSLAGNYIGGTASAAFGPGLGANALVGGNGSSIALQPLSAEMQHGIALAAGVASLKLGYVR